MSKRMEERVVKLYREELDDGRSAVYVEVGNAWLTVLLDGRTAAGPGEVRIDAAKLFETVEEGARAVARRAARPGPVPAAAGYTCPLCKSPLFRKRLPSGREFYGCPEYPACKGSRDLDGRPKATGRAVVFSEEPPAGGLSEHLSLAEAKHHGYDGVDEPEEP